MGRTVSILSRRFGAQRRPKLWQIPSPEPFEHDRSEVILLRSAAGKSGNRRMQRGNDLGGAEVPCSPNCSVQPVESEIVTLRVGPFKKAVGDQNQHISRCEAEPLGRAVGHGADNSERHSVRVKTMHLVFRGRVEEERSVSGRQELDATGPLVEDPGNEGD